MAKGGGAHIGSKVAMPAVNHHATSAEIEARTKNTYQNPDSSFKQLGPGDSPGGSLADLNPIDISGDTKLGKI